MTARRRAVRSRTRALTLALACAAGFVLGACAGGSAESTATPAPLFGAGYPVFRDEVAGIRTVFGTPDLGVGANRVAFVMSTDEGLVSAPTVRAESYFYADGPDGPRTGPVAGTVATFQPFPLVERGLYATTLDFDRAGTWGLDVHARRSDGADVVTTFTFAVEERPRSVAVGEAAPASRNRTLADVTSVAMLTTGSAPALALYDTRIVDALAERVPLVVVFASPAFCTNELCGPQVEVVGELAAEYGDRARFVHIDIYENPDEIRGDLSRAVRTPILEEWGITTDEWTFVIDREGRVAARFESFASKAELARALDEVLGR